MTDTMEEHRAAYRDAIGAIKPCPFCGGTDVSVNPGSSFRWVYAGCNGCGAQAGEVRVNTLADDREKALREAHAGAMVEWNTRAPA